MGGVGGFYDSDGVFEAYTEAVRPGPSSPNHVMEEPAVLDAVGDVAGLRVLDLGCGDAALGSRLLRAGCRSYLGIDASARMVDAARATLRGGPGEVRRGMIEAFSALPDSYDLVISRMALHYVEDLAGPLVTLACRPSAAWS